MTKITKQIIILFSALLFVSVLVPLVRSDTCKESKPYTCPGVGQGQGAACKNGCATIEYHPTGGYHCVPITWETRLGTYFCIEFHRAVIKTTSLYGPGSCGSEGGTCGSFALSFDEVVGDCTCTLWGDPFCP